MALQLTKIRNQLFPHSKIFDQGLGGMRIGMATFVVAQDGSGDFEQVQGAIDALSNSGGGIYIKEGTYNSFLLNKSKVYIEGTGESTIIRDAIAGAGGGTIIRISVNSCSLNNLKISISNTNWVGIHINDAKNNIQLKNIIIDGGDEGATYGIFTDGTPDKILLTECQITDLNYGIYIGGSKNIISNCLISSCVFGMQTDGLTNSVVSNNTFSNCTGRGLILSDDNNSSDNNTISGNTASGNGSQGIEIFGDCDNNIIIGNNCYNNDIGIKLTTTGIRVPDKNIVIGNNCLSNTTSAITDGGTNTHPNGASGTNNLALDDLNIIA